MVGTRSHPDRKLTKEEIKSRVKGNIRKHKAKKKPSPPAPKTPLSLPQQANNTTTMEEVSPPRPLTNTPPVTPIINITSRIPGKPITRRDTLTCLDFGKYHRVLYPGALFCSSCDWWEEELHHRPPMNAKKGKTRVSNKYACTCNHTSFVQPLEFERRSNSMNDDQHLPFASSVAKQPHPLPTQYKHYDPSVLLMPSPADEISYFADTTINQSDSSDMDDED